MVVRVVRSAWHRAPESVNDPAGRPTAGAGPAAPVSPASRPPGIHDATVAQGVVWQASLRWLGQLLAWTATIVVARRLSASDYGIAGAATVSVGFLSLVFDSGIARALTFRREQSETVLRQAHGAAILLGMLLALALMVGAVPASRFFREPAMVPVVMSGGLTLVAVGFTTVPMALLQRQLRYRELATIDLGRATVQAATVLGGALLGWGYWSLVAGLLAGAFSGVALTSRWSRIAPAVPTRAALAPTLSYARQLVVGVLAWYAYSNADFIVVGRVLGVAALGYYQFAWNIAQLPGEKLANILQAVAGPFFGAIGDDRVALRHYFVLLSLLLASVMIPVLVGFALVAPVAVPLVFGAKWVPAIILTQLLIARAAIGSLSLLSHHVLGATGSAHVTARVNLAAVLVLPVAFLLAAKWGGPIWVAVVWLLAQPLLIAVPLAALRTAIDLTIPQYLVGLWPPVFCSAVMAITVFVLRSLLSGLPAVALLVVLSCIGAAVYVLSYRVLFPDPMRSLLVLWRDRGAKRTGVA